MQQTSQQREYFVSTLLYNTSQTVFVYNSGLDIK